MLFKNYDQLVSNGQTPVLQQKRRDVLEMLSAAVEAVDPYLVVERVFQGTQLQLASESIDLSTFDHVSVVGFGKASVRMVQAISDAIPITKGVVITNDPSAIISHKSVEMVVGGHPLPNEGSVRGAEEIFAIFKECTENDCVIVCISGGGSALFEIPRVSLEDLRNTTDLLLRSGVNIGEFNTVRKHLSQVKGGQLVGFTKGVVISLIISDVINDPITSIASGPTSPDPTTFSDTKEIFRRYHLWENIPPSVKTVTEEGIAGRITETPKENNPMFHSVYNFIIANNELACQAAMKKAEELGYKPKLLSTSVSGEAKKIGAYLIGKVKQSVSPGKSVFITGGETTVTVCGNGHGGRNQELVLSCIEEIDGTEMVIASFATDGQDGNSPSAGALVDGMSLVRAKKQKLNPSLFLRQNNTNEFFVQLSDILFTGPTGTNVMDIQIFIR
jgi:glycerate 2-kinase